MPISEAVSAVDKNQYPCDQCNKSYSKACNLSRHIARIHDSNAQDVKQCDLSNEKITDGHVLVYYSQNIDSTQNWHPLAAPPSVETPNLKIDILVLLPEILTPPEIGTQSVAPP